jgi:predicted Zn-dependent protease
MIMRGPLNRGLHHQLLAVSYLLASALTASAEESASKVGSGLISPAEVVLYIHSDLKSTGFVQPLVCALQRVLTAPVSVQTLDIPLGAELLATKTQFDVRKVADRFVQATARSGNQPSFKYLLIPFDMKDASLRYVFSTSFGNETVPYHVGIVSTARLDPGNPVQPNREGHAITAMRAYKLMLKSIARLAGLRSPDACVLSFPRGLEELDQKSSEFCANDRAALVDAGILRGTEQRRGTDCDAVAQREPFEWLVVARGITRP